MCWASWNALGLWHVGHVGLVRLVGLVGHVALHRVFRLGAFRIRRSGDSQEKREATSGFISAPHSGGVGF